MNCNYNILNSMKVIETGRSTLNLIQAEPSIIKLLEKCDMYVEPLLESNLEIIVYGKKCVQRRNISFFSDKSMGYEYSNNIVKSKPLGEHLTPLIKFVNDKFGTHYNGILVNKYGNGHDYIGAHSDSEKNLEIDTGVVCIATGYMRKFRIRGKVSKKIVCDLETSDFIQMSGDFQQEFTHEIPKQLKVKESRISYTFRYHTK